MIDIKYFREYRKILGFTNQNEVKNFFGAKDLAPLIDLYYIDSLNVRLENIVDKVNSVVNKSVSINDTATFKKKYIYDTYSILKNADILPLLNNQGRRPEHVYFSWMRGYVFSLYFLKTLGLIFETNIENIELIGDDDLINIDTFKRTPKADIQILQNNSEYIRVEMQTGFTGINDIKQHKVIEAKRVKERDGISTFAIHFDIFNGQAAFIKLDSIEEDNMNWITRQQMEGQTVFNIDQNYFSWKLMDHPPLFRNLISNL